jgi:hypothetical protein
VAGSTSLTTRQRRELRDAGHLIGGRVSVYAFAMGRANPRLSAGARWIAGLFGAAFVLILVTLHVVLIPGFLVAYLLYDSVRPRRGVAVTTDGLTEVRLRTWNGRPGWILATTDHGALAPARIEPTDGKPGVRFGAETVSLRDRELERLRAAVASATQPAIPGGLPLPAPPGGGAPWTRAVPDELPGWRQATVLRVLGHLSVGLMLFIVEVSTAIIGHSALGRDTEHTSHPASMWFWAVFIGATLGWMLFCLLAGHAADATVPTRHLRGKRVPDLFRDELRLLAAVARRLERGHDLFGDVEVGVDVLDVVEILERVDQP